MKLSKYDFLNLMYCSTQFQIEYYHNNNNLYNSLNSTDNTISNKRKDNTTSAIVEYNINCIQY